MPSHYRLAVLALTLAAPAALLLTGCSGATSVNAATNAPAIVAGNWEFKSSAVAAAHLPVISGEISTTSAILANTRANREAATAAPITGILHSQGTSSCIAPATSFEVSGSADSAGNLTLTGPLAGGTLTIKGTLASDGKSLSDASYNVTGGSCAFIGTVPATAQDYNPISGNYDGTFTDTDGVVATISATLNQSPDASGDGNYTLSGSAALPNNPCFSTSTLTLSSTQVTGGTFTFSFTDPVTTASVTANGTFSSDAAALTVTGWTLTNCSTDTGTGTMTRQ